MGRLQVLAMSFSIAMILIIACHKDHSSNNKAPRLIENHCGSCHMVPDPSSLTKEVWNEAVLPKMSEYFIWPGRSQYTYANKSFYNKLGSLSMDDERWTEIVSYFSDQALDTITIRPESQWPIQSIFKESAISITDQPAAVTALYLDDEEVIVSSDKQLYHLNRDMSIRKKVPTGRDITQIYQDDEKTYLVNSGYLDPHEGEYGDISIYDNREDTLYVIIDSLKRPVQMSVDDEDIWVSEFGYQTGRLTLRNKDTSMSPTLIHSLPGSYRLKKARLVKGEEPVLITSISQGQEGIFMITFEDDRYRMDPLLRYIPEFGLSDVDVADINGDGLDDLLIANGDNADYSIMPKEYHGVRLYLNQGNKKFAEVYRFNLYGVTQAQFIDANADGQLDIIVSAYFAEHDSERVSILLSQPSDVYEFEPYAFELSGLGRWMVMETGDIDDDGDDDVVLGSYLKGPMVGRETTFEDLLILRQVSELE